MLHPFWIINSSLLALCACATAFMFYGKLQLPEREDIDPALYSYGKTEHRIIINPKHIYENDLFGTFKKPEPFKPVLEVVAPPPEPPRPQKITIPEPTQPAFLEPLNITLKGIIVSSSDESKNSAIISDNKTDLENTYAAGDQIQDAQLVRIFNNKVLLLRMNGQQEILYLKEQDAQKDPAFARIENWHPVVQQKGVTLFSINPTAFVKRVENLPRFIELLGLTTVYQEGKSIGTRIGNREAGSLATYMGLRAGDVIVSVNNIAATTVSNRLEIYNTVIKTEAEDKIIVDVIRNNRSIRLEYIIEKPHEETIIKKKKAEEPAMTKSEYEPEYEDMYDYITAPEYYDTENEGFSLYQRKRDTNNMIKQDTLSSKFKG